MIDRFKVKFGEHFQVTVSSRANVSLIPAMQKNFLREDVAEELNRLKMVVLSVGIDEQTGLESYFLFYDSTVNGGRDLPWAQMEQWYTKIFVESNFELCNHPDI
jgi:hypothetical protein